MFLHTTAVHGSVQARPVGRMGARGGNAEVGVRQPIVAAWEPWQPDPVNRLGKLPPCWGQEGPNVPATIQALAWLGQEDEEV